MPKTKTKAKVKTSRRKTALTRSDSVRRAWRQRKARNKAAAAALVDLSPRTIRVEETISSPADTQSQSFNHHVVEPNLGFLQDKYLTAQALLTDASEALQQAAELHRQRQEACQKAYNELKKACATVLDA